MAAHRDAERALAQVLAQWQWLLARVHCHKLMLARLQSVAQRSRLAWGLLMALLSSCCRERVRGRLMPAPILSFTKSRRLTWEWLVARVCHQRLVPCLAVCAMPRRSTSRVSPKVDAGSAVTLKMVQGPGAPCGSASPKVDAGGSTVASKGALLICQQWYG